MVITIIGIICATVLALVLGDQIINYKLKKENIKADAMIKTEEIRARNQLEMERLMMQGQNRPDRAYQERDSFSADSASIREKANG